MDSPIKPQTKQTCNIYELACDFCAFVKSRRDGVSADVRGVNRFMCAECCERTGTIRYTDYYGLDEWSIFPAEGVA